MNIALSILAVVILTTGIIVGWDDSVVDTNTELPTTVDTQDVLSEEDEELESEDTLPKSTVTFAPTETLSPTETPTEMPSSYINTSFSNYIYPNARITSQNSSSIVLESSDNATSVTDWYKNTINNQGMNVTSFVVTSTNDTVLNKLSATDGSREIVVTITKDPNTNVIIEVNI